jgi:DNA-binding transcriptional LysR family regulator
MTIMKNVHLAGVDLNLLVVFDALIAEGHATRAAQRIGLTQPAVSHALNRLRALFGDPLFVRSPRGMVPTPLAQDMAADVRSVLEQVEGILLGGRAFDPMSSRRQFTIGLSDYAAFVLLPPLTARLDREAPDVSLVVRDTSRGIGLSMLEDGVAELLAGNFPPPPTHMRSERLYEEEFVCASRRDHPDIDGEIDLDRYLSLRHLQVSMKGSPKGSVDALLARRGLERRVAVTVGHFLMAPMLADASDLVATEPRRLFASLAERLPLRLFRPPIEIAPFPVVQAWHARHDADPGHRWLRQVLREVGASV